MKKIFNLLIVVAMVFATVCLTGCNNKKEDKITIVATSFPGYDFARAVTKNIANVEVKMLLKPGSEMHDYEPTPQDIKTIKNSDMFIYVGGDSDEWIEDVIEDINVDETKIIKLMDLVDVVEEELVEGMEEHDHDHEEHDHDHEDHEDHGHEDHDHEEHDHEDEEVEYDEHVWTSPVNAIKIVKSLQDEIIKLDESNKESYENNTQEYVSKLENINKQIKDVVKNAKRTEVVFGDRFPLRYFVDTYNLSYYAAFPGCSEQTEASAKTISFLIEKVKEDKIPVVFHIELSNGKIANTIAKETGAKVLEFNSAHNITQSDFDAGVTYVDIMEKNISVLKEALN